MLKKILFLACFILWLNQAEADTVPFFTQFVVCDGITRGDTDLFKKPVNPRTVFKQGENVQLLVEAFFGWDKVEASKTHRFILERYCGKKYWDTIQTEWRNKKKEPFPVSHFTPVMPNAYPGNWVYRLTLEIEGSKPKVDSLKFTVERTEPDFIFDGLFFCKRFEKAENDSISPINEGSRFYQNDPIQILILLRNVWVDYSISRTHIVNGSFKWFRTSPLHDVSGTGGFWKFPYFNEWIQDGEKELGSHEVYCFINIPGQEAIELDHREFTVMRSSISVKEECPTVFSLQNYPNPFNPVTTIVFSLPNESFVSADIYNSAGQFVKNLAQGRMASGKHAVLWDASANAAGIYFCVVKSKNRTKVIKMMLTK